MFKFIFYFILSACLTQLTAQTITIGSNGDFANLSAAQSSINPGDTVIVLNQTFTDNTQYLNGVNGTATKPVVIIAEKTHQSVFKGGSEAIHLVNCNFIELNGFIFEEQTGNGINIDDGADYRSPASHITIRNCIFRNLSNKGNHDFIKMSGVDNFLIENCSLINGSSGSGMDLVGCHNGIVQDCTFDNAGSNGVQTKGGSQFITIRRNVLKNMTDRALNIGGSTGLAYFRPALPSSIVEAFEAADIDVYANIFIGSNAQVAYVGCVRVKVSNNTFYKPEKWVIRILQQNNNSGFLPCSNNEFSNNIIYQETDLTEVNIGGNTNPESFVFTNNLWFNASSSSWRPKLPVADKNQQIGDPLFSDGPSYDFTLQAKSPAVGAGKSNFDTISDFDQKYYSNPPSIGAYERD